MDRISDLLNEMHREISYVEILYLFSYSTPAHFFTTDSDRLAYFSVQTKFLKAYITFIPNCIWSDCNKLRIL